MKRWLPRLRESWVVVVAVILVLSVVTAVMVWALVGLADVLVSLLDGVVSWTTDN